MIKIMTLVFFSIALLTTHSHADTEKNLIECLETADSKVRLVCYDKLANSAKDLQSNLTNTTQDTTVAHTAEKAVTKVNLKQNNTFQSKKNQFGSEDLKSNSRDKDDLTQVIFTVKSAQKNTQKKWKIIFTNEQVWKQTNLKYINVAAGDQVELSKGKLGSHHLKILGSNRSIRVKRIK